MDSGTAKSPGRDGVATPVPTSQPASPPKGPPVVMGPPGIGHPLQTPPMNPPPPPMQHQPQQMPFTGMTGMLSGLNVDPAMSTGCLSGMTPAEPNITMAMMTMLQTMQNNMQQQNQYLVGVMERQQQVMNAVLESMKQQSQAFSQAQVQGQTPQPQQVGGQTQSGSSGAPVPKTGNTGNNQTSQQIFKSIDSKVLPPMPTADVSKWTTRPAEILGFHAFTDQLIAWIGMMSPEFGREVRDAMNNRREIETSMLSQEQVERSARLYYLLKQALEKSGRVSSLIKLHESSLGLAAGTNDTNGFRLLQRIRDEFSLKTRTEAMHFRQILLQYQVKVHGSVTLKDLVNLLDAEWISLQKIFATALEPATIADCMPAEADKYRWLMGNLPSEPRRYVQLHSPQETYDSAKETILKFYEKTLEQEFKPQGNLSLSSFNLAAMSAGGDSSDSKTETRECWNCGKKGHLSRDCRAPRRDKSPAGSVKSNGSGKGGSSKGTSKGKSKDGKNRSSKGSAKGSGKKQQSHPKGKGSTKGKRAAEFSEEENGQNYDETAEVGGTDAEENQQNNEEGWSEADPEEGDIRLAAFIQVKQEFDPRFITDSLDLFQFCRGSCLKSACVMPFHEDPTHRAECREFALPVFGVPVCVCEPNTKSTNEQQLANSMYQPIRLDGSKTVCFLPPSLSPHGVVSSAEKREISCNRLCNHACNHSLSPCKSCNPFVHQNQFEALMEFEQEACEDRDDRDIHVISFSQFLQLHCLDQEALIQESELLYVVQETEPLEVHETGWSEEEDSMSCIEFDMTSYPSDSEVSDVIEKPVQCESSGTSEQSMELQSQCMFEHELSRRRVHWNEFGVDIHNVGIDPSAGSCGSRCRSESTENYPGFQLIFSCSGCSQNQRLQQWQLEAIDDIVQVVSEPRHEMPHNHNLVFENPEEVEQLKEHEMFNLEDHDPEVIEWDPSEVGSTTFIEFIDPECMEFSRECREYDPFELHVLPGDGLCQVRPQVFRLDSDQSWSETSSIDVESDFPEHDMLTESEPESCDPENSVACPPNVVTFAAEPSVFEWEDIAEIQRNVTADRKLKSFISGCLSSHVSENLSLGSWWLLDSGASRSVISEKYLDMYQVTKQRELQPPIVFSTASGEKVEISKEVVVRMSLRHEHGMIKGLLVRCLVSQVEHNLISVFGVCRQGWTFRMTQELCEVTIGAYRLYPILWSNCPWLKADEWVPPPGKSHTGANREVLTYPGTPRESHPESVPSPMELSAAVVAAKKVNFANGLKTQK